MSGSAVEPWLAIGFGPTEILLALGIAILLFGAKKLPLVARGLGAGIRNFKGQLSAPRDEQVPLEDEEVEHDPR